MSVFFRFSTVLIIVLLFAVSFASSGLAQDGKAADDESKKEAERLWELAIAAKGGRERLESVNNMVFSGENHLYRFGFRVRRNNQPKYVTLDVFPDKFWVWNDMRPSIFGLLIHMKDFNSNMYYTAPNHIKGDNIQPLEVEKDGRVWGQKQSLIVPQITSFMETKWVKPIPVKASKGYLTKKWVNIIEAGDGKKRKNLVDIIQTEVLDGRVDFVLDSKTHLPIRIGFFMSWYANSSGGHDEQVNTQEVYSVVDIPEYVEINGIKMPHYKGSTVQLNVDYDKSIFSIPTTVAEGYDAWKPKK